MKIVLILFNILLLSTFVKLFIGLTDDFQISDILGHHNAEVIEYNKYKEKYDDERMLYVLITADKNHIFKINDELTKALLFVPGLEKVTSINLLEYLNYESVENRVFLRKFYSDGKLSKKGFELLTKEPLFKNSYLSPDQSSILTSLTLKKNLPNIQIKETINNLRSLKKEIANLHNADIFLLGSKLASFHFNKELRNQQSIISPISFIIIALIFTYLFRSLSVLLIGFYYIAMVFLSSGVIIFCFENNISPYTNFALFFIYVMATSDFIHFSHSYAETKGSLAERLDKAIRKVIKPCFYTTLTTAIAFLSLGFSDIEVIRDFGIYSAIGITLSFLVNFYYLPYFLKIFNINLQIQSRPFLESLKKNYLKHFKLLKWPFYIVFLIIVILFTSTIKNINFDDNLYDKFVKSHEMTKSVYQFNDKFQFTGSLDLIRSTKSQDFLSIDYEKRMEEFTKEIEALPNVTLTRSLNKYLKYARNEMQAFPPRSFTEDHKMQNVYDLLHRNKLTDDVYNSRYNEEKITIGLKSLESSKIKLTLDKVKELLKKHQLDFTISGFAPIRLKMLTAIVDGFLKNFLGTFIIIFLIFIYIFRSLKWALIAMIPNTLPIMSLLTLMTLWQTQVEDSLLLLLSAIIGISVDDTIHFLFKFRENIKKKKINEALQETFNSTYKALFTTTLIFIAVSPSYFISNLSLIHKMAVFFNIGLVIALICDFYFLPNLLSFLQRKSNES